MNGGHINLWPQGGITSCVTLKFLQRKNMSWFPLRNYTHYSLRNAYSKPEHLVKKCKENGYDTCGICDYKTIAGTVEFFQACKEGGIKPIIGCSFDDFAVFVKNKNGWFDLIKLVSSLDKNGQLQQDLATISKNNNFYVLSGKDFTNCDPSYYVDQQDAKLHRILLCSEMKTTLPQIRKSISENKLVDKVDFFIHDTFYVLDKEESKSKDTKVLDQIRNQCEDYNILSKPILPKFPCPNNLSEEEYLKELCRKGWKKLLVDQSKVKDETVKTRYLDRFKEEFEVIKNATLFGYFLVVQDIIHYVNSRDWLTGPGRGSAAGCLISYLIGITKIDPIEFDLLFARFYNAGRNTADYVSLPDIDIDVPGNKRDEVIAYLKEKYGHNHVSQMITLGSLQGKSAIKEVLRVNEACSFAEMNAISNCIPDEARISDQLEEMYKEDRSIIKWALINNSEELKDFCRISEDGKLEGDYAEFFDQAIKIEGTYKSKGKHPAGVVISAEPLEEVCPMVCQDGTDEKIVGLEMSALEALGRPKLDILAINLLDKLMYIEELTGATNG